MWISSNLSKPIWTYSTPAQLRSIAFLSNVAWNGVHPFRHFFRHFRFWRFRHPHKTLVPPLYLKSPRFFKILSLSALIFSVSVLFVSFSAPTVSVSAQKQQMFSSLQAFLLYTLFRPLMALAVWVLFPAPPPPCDVYCLSWLSRC